jgi:hypothetical protein
VAEDERQGAAGKRDEAATRRDVDAGVRDRMADEDMSESERGARADAARDRMAAMGDRQDAARDRGEPSHDDDAGRHGGDDA